MAGTVLGGRRAAATNKQRYGLGFYKQIGRKGGLGGKGTARGFALMSKKRVSELGHKGGSAPRRTTAKSK